MKRLAIIGLLLIFLLFMLRFAFGYWLNSRLTSHLNNRSERLYDVQYSNLDFSIIQGSVWLNDFELIPRPEVVNDLVAKKQNPELVMHLEVGHVELVSLDYFRLAKNELLVENILIENPSVQLFLLPKPDQPDSTLPAPHAREFSYSRIALQSFEILDAETKVFKVSKADTSVFGTMNDFDFLVKGFSYVGTDGKAPVEVLDVELSAAEVRLDDLAGHVLTLDSMNLDFLKNTLVLKAGTFEPVQSVEEFDQSTPVRKPYFSYTFQEMVLSDVAYELALYQEWKAKHLHLDGFEASIYINNSKPFPEGKKFDFITSKIRSIPSPVALDSISLSNCSFTYQLPGKELERRAALYFERINGFINGFTNLLDTTKAHEYIEANISCVPHATGKVQSYWKFDLLDPHDHFEVDLTLTDADLVKFNSIIERTTHVHVASGNIPKLEFAMRGDTRKAAGTAYYELNSMDLRMNAVKDAKKSEKKFLSFVVNNVVRAKHEESRHFRAKFTINRGEQTSFFKFVWEGLQAGLKNGFMHNTYKKELREQKNAENKHENGLFKKKS